MGERERGKLGQSYIILGGWFVKLLYNVIWVTKIDIFLLYNMWMAPKVSASVVVSAVRCQSQPWS